MGPRFRSPLSCGSVVEMKLLCGSQVPMRLLCGSVFQRRRLRRWLESAGAARMREKFAA